VFFFWLVVVILAVILLAYIELIRPAEWIADLDFADDFLTGTLP